MTPVEPLLLLLLLLLLLPPLLQLLSPPPGPLPEAGPGPGPLVVLVPFTLQDTLLGAGKL